MKQMVYSGSCLNGLMGIIKFRTLIVFKIFLLLTRIAEAQSPYTINSTGNLSSTVIPANVAACDVFNINADIHIDQSYVFTKCTLYVAAGVQLILDNNCTATFHSCLATTSSVTDTWWGIYAGFASNVITIDNASATGCSTTSIFANMDLGIVCENDAVINAANTSFLNNSFSIQIYYAYANVYPGVIENNNFTGTSSMLVNSTSLTWSYAGIATNDVSHSTATDEIAIGSSGNGNTFSYLIYGIFNNISNLNSEGNSFHHCGYTGSGFAEQGGIFIHNSTGDYSTIVVNEFTDCIGMGIYYSAIASNLNVTGNLFDGVENQNIYIISSFEASVLMDNNTFDNFGVNGGNQNCIHCEDNDGTNTTHTAITINNNNRIQNNDNRRAIVCEEASNTDFVNLTIENNAIAFVRHGIFISNINNAKVSENQVSYSYTNASGGAFAYGIALFNSDYASVADNTVTGDNHSSTIGAGIFTQSSENDVIQHNTVSTAGYLIAARFNCTGTNFLCNDLEDGANGFFLTQINSSGGVLQLGPVGASGTPADNVWGYSSTWSGNEINCNGSVTNGANGSWYNVDAGCSGSCGGSPCAWFIPTNNVNTSLSSNPMNLIQDCSSQTCSPAYSGRGPSDVRDKLLLAIVSAADWQSYSTGTEGDFYNDREKAYGYLVQHPEWLEHNNSNDDYYSAFMSSMNGSNTAIINQARTLMHNGNIDDANTLLGQLEPSNTQEENWKAVLEIYAVT